MDVAPGRKPGLSPESGFDESDVGFLRRALTLARRGYGRTSPNPMVGAVLVRRGLVIGEGWHRRAGGPHAEIEALQQARRLGHEPAGATLYVTLEPCSTHGRTPPCTEALIASRIRRVVVGAADPNPRHAGRGFEFLRRAGLEVESGLLADECERLNETFNHWIVTRTPFVTLKAAMTLDGKLATVAGESKWITGERSRALGMRLRRGADAILVGVNTVLADDPSLTARPGPGEGRALASGRLRRVILDSRARTPTKARVVTDASRHLTILVCARAAPARRVTALQRVVRVMAAPADRNGRVDLPWLMRALGAEDITHLLVEGGSEVAASFVEARLVQRVALFYAPMVIGGKAAPRAVGGAGARSWDEVPGLDEVQWRRLGPDLFLTARVTR